MFASGTADGHAWRLAVQDIADPGYRCMPAITINGTDADLLSPDPGNGADVAIGAAAPGIGFAFVQVTDGIDGLLVNGQESVPAIAVTVCGQRYRVVGLAYRLKHPPRLTAQYAGRAGRKTKRGTEGGSPDWPAVYPLPLISIQPPGVGRPADLRPVERRAGGQRQADAGAARLRESLVDRADIRSGRRLL